MSRSNSLVEIAEFLKGQQKLTLLCHARPDGDTLGCAFGLKAVLEGLGKEVRVLCSDPVSPRYLFLSEGVEDLTGQPMGALVCLDVASPDMAGDYKGLALQADVVIDHHATNPGYGKMNFIDGTAAAAGEILLDLAKLLGPLPEKAAVYFYTAISTDTGCFKYGNTTARTHRAAAELAECGIDLAALNKWLFQTKRRAEFELNRLAMEQIHYFDGDRIVTMRITQAMLQETGSGPDELEVISSMPIQIEGVVAAATFKELPDGSHKVSLRTDGSIHGGEICALFGGGGHRQASGCTMVGAFDEIEKKMTEALKKALETV